MGDGKLSLQAMVDITVLGLCMNLGGVRAEARITEETGNMIDDLIILAWAMEKGSALASERK